MPISNDALETMAPRPYEAVKGDIRTGDLILCSGTGAFSRLIRAATSSPWSHIAIAGRLDPLDKVIVMESVEKIGVRTVAPKSFLTRDSNGANPRRPIRLPRRPGRRGAALRRPRGAIAYNPAPCFPAPTGTSLQCDKTTR
jgi:hypothetical protein